VLASLLECSRRAGALCDEPLFSSDAHQSRQRFSVYLMPRARLHTDTSGMASVPDWTTDGYSFRGERSSSRGFVRGITEAIRRIAGRSQPAPPVSKSLVYALCEEYRHFDLWAAYHAFRLDPHARNWRRLRRRSVPWQREQTVEGLVHRLHPLNGKRTPDATTVGLALITAAGAPAKKKR
jgi:hypothetical protein